MADAPKDRDVLATVAQVDNPSYQDNLKVRRDPDGSLWIVDAQGRKVMSGVPADQRALGISTSSDGGMVFSEPVPIPAEVMAALPAELAGLSMSRVYTYLRRWGEHNLSFDALFPGWASWQSFYVDVGAASNGTGTLASPYWSIHAAVAAANSSGQPARILVKGGATAVRTKGISNSGAVIPAVNIVFIAYSGRIVSSNHEALTWAVDAGVTTGTVYKATRSNVASTVDLLGRDEGGCYPRLTQRASAADVGRYGGSYSDGAAIWVARPDGAVVSDVNTRCYLAVDNAKLSGTAQVSVAFVGQQEGDGWDFEGGQSGAFRVLYTGGGAAARNIIYAKDATFRYGGHITGAVGNVAIEGFNGSVILERCDWSNGATDGVNIHNALGATKLALLTINCTGRKFGLTAAYTSNNFWTLHDSNVVGIDLCSEGWDCMGVSAHIINSSIGFLAGTRLHRSQGDIPNGGGNPPCELKSQDTAKLYTWNVQTDPVGGGYAMRSEGAGAIYIRGGQDVQGMRYTGPTARIASW